MKQVELVADLVHDVWADWMRYMFSKCSVNINGELVIPKELEERWSRQMNTPYDNLSEGEKFSAKTLAEKYIKLIYPDKEKKLGVETATYSISNKEKN